MTVESLVVSQMPTKAGLVIRAEGKMKVYPETYGDEEAKNAGFTNAAAAAAIPGEPGYGVTPQELAAAQRKPLAGEQNPTYGLSLNEMEARTLQGPNWGQPEQVTAKAAYADQAPLYGAVLTKEQDQWRLWTSPRYNLTSAQYDSATAVAPFWVKNPAQSGMSENEIKSINDDYKAPNYGLTAEQMTQKAWTAPNYGLAADANEQLKNARRQQQEAAQDEWEENKNARESADQKIANFKAAHDQNKALLESNQAKHDSVMAEIAESRLAAIKAKDDINDAKAAHEAAVAKYNAAKAATDAAVAKIAARKAAKEAAEAAIAKRGTPMPDANGNAAVPIASFRIALSAKFDAKGDPRQGTVDQMWPGGHVMESTVAIPVAGTGVFLGDFDITPKLDKLYGSQHKEMATTRITLVAEARSAGGKILKQTKEILNKPGGKATDKLLKYGPPQQPVVTALTPKDNGFFFTLKVKSTPTAEGASDLVTGTIKYSGAPNNQPAGPIVGVVVQGAKAENTPQTGAGSQAQMDIVYTSTTVQVVDGVAGKLQTDGSVEYTLTGHLDNTTIANQAAAFGDDPAGQGALVNRPAVLFVNELSYECAFFAINIFGESVLSEAKVVKPTNLPHHLTKGIAVGSTGPVRTNFRRKAGAGPAVYEYAYANPQNVVIAASLQLVYNDNEVGTPNTCQVTWGVVAGEGANDQTIISKHSSRSGTAFSSTPDPKYKPLANADGQPNTMGVTAAAVARCSRTGGTKVVDGAQVLDGEQRLLLEIPLEWFKDSNDQLQQSILVNAFVSQTSINGQTTLVGAKMGSPVRIYLVRGDALQVMNTGDLKGPLDNGILCTGVRADGDGAQAFQFSGKLNMSITQNNPLTAKWMLAQKNDAQGNGRADATSAMTVVPDVTNKRFSARTVKSTVGEHHTDQEVSYAALTQMASATTKLKFESKANDANGSKIPAVQLFNNNGTWAGENAVFVHKLEAECDVHAFKDAVGALQGSIKRNVKGAGKAPTCVVDAGQVQLNGWKLGNFPCSVKQADGDASSPNPDVFSKILPAGTPANEGDAQPTTITFDADANQGDGQHKSYSAFISFGRYRLDASLKLSDSGFGNAKSIYTEGRSIDGATTYDFLALSKKRSEETGGQHNTGSIQALVINSEKSVYYDSPVVKAIHMNQGQGDNAGKLTVRLTTKGSVIPEAKYQAITIVQQKLKDGGGNFIQPTQLGVREPSIRTATAFATNIEKAKIQNLINLIPDKQKSSREDCWDVTFQIDPPADNVYFTNPTNTNQGFDCVFIADPSDPANAAVVAGFADNAA